MKKLTAIAMCSLLLFACKKEDPTDDNNNNNNTNNGPNLIFKFQFDSSQERLDNFGNPSTIPAGNAGISPTFNSISGHFPAPDVLFPGKWCIVDTRFNWPIPSGFASTF